MAADINYDHVPGEPPSPTRPSTGVWIERLAPLVLDPGEWYRIAEGPRKSIENMASAMRNGRYKIPSGKWKFASRRYEDNETGGLWARYDGPDNDPDTPDTSGDGIDNRGATRRPAQEDAVDDTPELAVEEPALE